MTLRAAVELVVDAFRSLSGDTRERHLQQIPRTEDTAPEPLEVKGPGPPSVDSFSMWDSQIDGLYVPEIRINDSEGTEGLDNHGYPPTPLDSAEWMPDELRERLLEARRAIRQAILRRRPRGPQRPMPA